MKQTSLFAIVAILGFGIASCTKKEIEKPADAPAATTGEAPKTDAAAPASGAKTFKIEGMTVEEVERRNRRSCRSW